MKRALICLLFMIGAPALAIGAENWERHTAPSVLLKQGAVRLSASQVRQLIVGKTESWGPDNSGVSAGYYSPDGTIYGRFSGERETAHYVIRTDGSVCMTFKVIPGGCQYYLRYKNKVVVVWRGSTRGVKRYQVGNRL